MLYHFHHVLIQIMNYDIYNTLCLNCSKKSVHHQKWSPGPILAGQNWSPLLILVPHENVISECSRAKWQGMYYLCMVLAIR